MRRRQAQTQEDEDHVMPRIKRSITTLDRAVGAIVRDLSSAASSLMYFAHHGQPESASRFNPKVWFNRAEPSASAAGHDGGRFNDSDDSGFEDSEISDSRIGRFGISDQ
jgi:hypothetical protein